MAEAGTWRRCSACKEPISLGATYWVCNVSTCNRKRTALAFCSVSCWEVHLPGANHREAWAVEKTAPLTPEEPGPAKASPEPSEDPPRRRRIAQKPPPRPAAGSEEVLIIASRLKDYVRATSGCNTSDRVLAPLSDILRRVVDEAVQNAIRDGRRTVLDRDVPKT